MMELLKRKVIPQGLIAASIGIELLIFHQASSRYPINHVSYEPRILYFVPFVLLMISFKCWIQFKKHGDVSAKWWLASIFVLMLLLITVAGVDQFNMLVEYETWIQRGMPALRALK